MCIIIHRPAGKILDPDKFATAILNNPDGYGMSVADGKGGLTTFRTSEEPNPEELYRIVHDEFTTEDVLLHLRYTTAGETNLRNTHPFPILEKRTHGVDIRMTHNGTLSKYTSLADKTKGESDTRAFVKLFVRPLFERLIKGMTSEEILSDPFVKDILEDQLSAASVLVFIDGYGNKLICNEHGNGGYTEDDVYYSNKYSFNKNHRTSVVYPSSYGSNYWSGWDDDGNYQSSNVKAITDNRLSGDTGTGQAKFTEQYGFTSMEDLFSLSDDTLDDVCNESPTDAAMLIKELLYELQLATNQTKSLQSQLSVTKSKLGELKNVA